MSYFENASFTFPSDNTNDINEWADYCELFCLLSENKQETIDGLLDRLKDQFEGNPEIAAKHLRLTGSRTGKFIVDNSSILEENPAPNDDEATNLPSDYIDVEPTQQESSESEDEIRNEMLFVFGFLEARETLFQDFYPFTITDKRRISLRPNLSPKQEVYIALLLSSLLRVYRKGVQNLLGHLFEDATFFVFKGLLPISSKLEYFGSGNANYPNTPFTGNFYQKVEVLASFLHADIRERMKANMHDYIDSGDGGLDWAAWLPLGDDKSHIPTFFAQCACGNDWIDKEFDAHPDKWTNYIHFDTRYKLFHFVCKSFRKQDGTWYRPRDIYNVVLVDRLRFLLNLPADSVDEVVHLYRNLIDEALTIQLSTND